jgi:hypothetical protein
VSVWLMILVNEPKTATSIIFGFQALFCKQTHLVAEEQNNRASVLEYDAPSQE